MMEEWMKRNTPLGIFIIPTFHYSNDNTKEIKQNIWLKNY